MRNADYIVDMGPGAGVHGGHIVAEGSPEEIMTNKRSLTGKYLSGELKIEIPRKTQTSRLHQRSREPRKTTSKISICNLPLGVLCGVTGVSGSGKSTLMNLTVIPALRQMFGEQVDKIGKHEALDVPAVVRNVIVIDQDPIGQNTTKQPSHLHQTFR